MFLRKIFDVFPIAVLLFFIGGCTSTDRTEVPQITSLTGEPLTTTRTQTYPITPMTVPSPTSTPAPTLPAEDAYSLLSELLQNNGGCRLPCWWGITPGESTPAEAYTILTPLRDIAIFDDLSATDIGNIILRYPMDGVFIDIRAGFLLFPGESTVGIIRVDTQALREVGDNHERIYGAAGYNELLGQYTLSSILSSYGSPPQVLVRAELYSNDTPGPDLIAITLLFPEQGIFIRYDGLGERVDDSIQGCPSKALITLWLLPTDRYNISYEQIISSQFSDWEENYPYSMSLEEATQMTVDEFYQTFKDPTGQCLETPLAIWPPGH